MLRAPLQRTCSFTSPTLSRPVGLSQLPSYCSLMKAFYRYSLTQLSHSFSLSSSTHAFYLHLTPLSCNASLSLPPLFSLIIGCERHRISSRFPQPGGQKKMKTCGRKKPGYRRKSNKSPFQKVQRCHQGFTAESSSQRHMQIHFYYRK